MRTVGRVLSIVMAVALVSPLVPSLLCARPGAPVMPCCKTQAPCDLQMQKSRCCSLERGPLSPSGAAEIQAGTPLSNPTRSQQLATVDPTVHGGVAAFARLADHPLWYPPSHGESVPLYLLNASILR